jgi:hypothetical protein
VYIGRNDAWVLALGAGDRVAACAAGELASTASAIAATAIRLPTSAANLMRIADPF